MSALWWGRVKQDDSNKKLESWPLLMYSIYGINKDELSGSVCTVHIDRDRDGPVYLPIFGLNKKLYKSPPPPALYRAEFMKHLH